VLFEQGRIMSGMSCWFQASATIMFWMVRGKCWCAIRWRRVAFQHLPPPSGHMLQGRGSAKNIVCPLHRWTYQTDGKLMGAPHFPQNPCLHLNKSPLQNWNGMLFSAARCRQRPGESRRDAGSGFLRLYAGSRAGGRIRLQLEDLHRGVSGGLHVVRSIPAWAFRGLRRPQVEFGEHYSVQTVGISNALRKVGTMCTASGRNRCCAITAASCRNTADLADYYPNIMSSGIRHAGDQHPRAARPGSMHQYRRVLLLEDIVLFEREYVKRSRRPINETAVEDDIICLRMHQGRKSLYQRGIDEQGRTSLHRRWDAAFP